MTEVVALDEAVPTTDEVAAALMTPAAPAARRGIDPLAVGQVDRVVKAALPTGMHVAKDARVAMHKAATICLLMISALAEEEKSHQTKRKATLTGQDIQRAFQAAGFGHLAQELILKRGR